MDATNCAIQEAGHGTDGQRGRLEDGLHSGGASSRRYSFQPHRVQEMHRKEINMEDTARIHKLADYIASNTSMAYHTASDYAFVVMIGIEEYHNRHQVECLINILKDLSGLDITEWLDNEYQTKSIIDLLKECEVDITSEL